MGTTLAFFQVAGTEHEVRERLKSLVREGTIVAPASFNSLGEMLSGPLALLTSRDFKRSDTSCSVMTMSSNVVSLSRLSCGSSASEVSMFECDKKKVLKMFAFALLSVICSPVMGSLMGGYESSAFLPKRDLQ